MTQPFCCDITSGTKEEQNEFKRLFNLQSKHNWEYRTILYGIDKDGDFGCEERKSYAKKYFKKVIPLSEGILILKKMVGEEDSKLDLSSALKEAISLLKRTTEYEVMDSWKDDVRRLENALQPKPTE